MEGRRSWRDVSGYGIGVYFAVAVLSAVVFGGRMLEARWLIWGSVETLVFWMGLKGMSGAWMGLGEKAFVRKVFGVALGVRLAYVVLTYFLYIYWTGSPFEFEAGDAFFYDAFGAQIAESGLGSAFELAEMSGVAPSDMGRPLELALIYSVTGHYVIVPRLVQSFLSAWSCVLVYKLAKRNFGEVPGRYAAIVMVLLHNSVYYCGLQLKESDMVFWTLLFLERSDAVLREGKLRFGNMVVPVVVGLWLFLFRTVLGAVAMMSFMGTMLLAKDASGKAMSWGKRIAVGGVMLLAMVPVAMDRYGDELVAYWEASGDNQSQGMEWRSERKGGNQFAKYGSTALFAPAILLIPFPTLVEVVGQDNQMMRHGGYLEKHVLSFFVYVALFYLVFKYKTWRRHLLLLMFLFGYLAVVAMSNFAMSERFHFPALPIFVILAGFGLSQVGKREWGIFPFYVAVMGVMVIGWCWFKLAGRGMV